MATRARLTAPQETPDHWPWHQAKTKGLNASLMFSGHRRMDAESYLLRGYGTRVAIESKSSGWSPLGEFAHVWQPARLKGIQVASEYGTPFLAATQVFDARPIPRKWLSLQRTDSVAKRFVPQGTILVTCSGTVGRATLARASLSDVLISHDLLRVEPVDEGYWGWLFAYLRAPSIVGLMQASNYGHIIKHLEVAHLTEVPVVAVGENARTRFSNRVRDLLDSRNRSESLIAEAEAILSDSLSLSGGTEVEPLYSVIRSADLCKGRRRMEGSFYSARTNQLLECMHRTAKRIDTLTHVVDRVWWMNRFNRNFGEDGVPYRSADDLFSISQISQKRVYTDPIPNSDDFFVREGWILMACSGQVYGLNGSVTMATNLNFLGPLALTRCFSG